MLNRPYGTAALVVLTIWLYARLILHVLHSTGEAGEDAIHDLIGAVLLAFALWLALGGLLVVGGVKGAMPRWAAIAAVPVHAGSGIAAMIALDACLKQMSWLIVVPAGIPVVTGLYAIWARFPVLHRWLPPIPASAVAGGVVLLLSALPGGRMP